MQIDFHCSNLTLSLDCVFRWPRTMCWCCSRSVAFFSRSRLLRLIFLTFTFSERDARTLLFFVLPFRRCTLEIVISLLPKKRSFYNNRRKSVGCSFYGSKSEMAGHYGIWLRAIQMRQLKNCLIWPNSGDKYWSAKNCENKNRAAALCKGGKECLLVCGTQYGQQLHLHVNYIMEA